MLTIKNDATLSPVVGEEKNSIMLENPGPSNKEKTKETILKDPMDRKRC